MYTKTSRAPLEHLKPLQEPFWCHRAVKILLPCLIITRANYLHQLYAYLQQFKVHFCFFKNAFLSLAWIGISSLIYHHKNSVHMLKLSAQELTFFQAWLQVVGHRDCTCAHGLAWVLRAPKPWLPSMHEEADAHVRLIISFSSRRTGKTFQIMLEKSVFLLWKF